MKVIRKETIRLGGRLPGAELRQEMEKTMDGL